MEIRCSQCGADYPLNTREWVCVRCGGLLELAGVPPFDPVRVERGTRSLWRYRAMLPLVQGSEPVSMGEGWTPLVPLNYSGRNVLGKFDFLNPTGSFKDRGTSVLTSACRALGLTNVVEDSSGNAAASLAGYAAYAGLHATIFAPAHASPVKLAQIEVYGAELRRVEGPREKSAAAAQQMVVEGDAYYASHYYNPFFLAGLQTTAWEIWEELGRVPDTVLVPAGHGTNLVGLYRGFEQLRARGLVERVPRMIAAQAAQVPPLALAFARGQARPVEVEPGLTVAEGVANSRPVHGPEVLQIVRETGGMVLAVAEDEIRAARLALARQGVFVEPTSATAVAALDRVLPEIPANELVVLCLTGNGLKAPL